MGVARDTIIEDRAAMGQATEGGRAVGQAGGWEAIKIEKAKMAWRL